MPKTKSFGGFRSPEAVLNDQSMRPNEKIAALKTWRATLLRRNSLSPDGAERQSILQRIEFALEELNKDGAHSNR